MTQLITEPPSNGIVVSQRQALIRACVSTWCGRKSIRRWKIGIACDVGRDVFYLTPLQKSGTFCKMKAENGGDFDVFGTVGIPE